MKTIIQIVVSGLLLGGIYSLLSIGLTLIFGVIRIVNFAHGDFLMLSMYGAYWLFTLWGVSPFLSVLIITPIFFLLGLAVQRVFVKPVLNASSLIQVSILLGLSIGLQNLCLLFWKGDYRGINLAISTSVIKVGFVDLGVPRLIAFIAALVISVLIYLFLKKTYLGKAIRATVQDRNAAELMGVDINRIYRLTFGLGIGCVGLAGPLLMPIYSVFPTVGLYFVLTAFVIVVLGGLGNVAGAFFGALIIGLVESFSGFFIAPALKEGVYFIIFILLLLVKPAGLFGQLGSEEIGAR